MKLMIDTLGAPLPGDVVLLHDGDGSTWLGKVRAVDDEPDTITYAACDETGQAQGNQDSCTGHITSVVGIIVGGFDYDTSDGAA